MSQTQPSLEQKPLGTPPPPRPPRPPPARPRPTSACSSWSALIAIAACVAGGRMWYRSHNFVDTENAYVAGHVHPVSARIAGIVTRVLVEDNQHVKAGDVIAELDPADQHVRVEQIEAQIASARQQVIQADAQVEQVRAQAQAAQAQVGQSQALALRARQDAERFGQLYTKQMKAVSKAEVDAANAARSAAAADVNARRDNASAAKAQINAAVLGTRRVQGPDQGAAGAAEGRQAAGQLQPRAGAGRRPHRPPQRGSGRARPAGPATGGRGRRQGLGQRQLQGNPAGRPERPARRSTCRSTRCRTNTWSAASTASRRPRATSSRCCRPITRPATSPRSCSACRSRSRWPQPTSSASRAAWCRACRSWPKSTCARRCSLPHRPAPRKRSR